MVSSGIAKWTLTDMSKGLNFNRNEAGWETRFGGEEWVCALAGRGLGLIREPLGLPSRKRYCCPRVGVSKCKLAFWVVAERVLYLLRVN